MQLKLPAESAPPEQVKHWRVRTTSRYRWGTSGRAVGSTFRHSPPLSFGIVGEAEDEATFGPEDAYDVFSIASGEASSGGVRVAFAARSPEAVDAFHTAALEAGGRDNGAPGPRPLYREGCYAAFVIDLNGNNVEAVHLS